MKNFKIPVTWEEYGYVNIEADTLEEALDIAQNDPTIGLPDGDYVDGSWEVDNEIAYCINDEKPKRKEYSVVIHYEGSFHFDIEADDQEQAEEIAEHLFGEVDCGDLDTIDWKVCDSWVNK